MTIMFCDIRGFTTISERFKEEPNRLAAIINRLLTQLTDDILKYGGTVDKYIGGLHYGLLECSPRTK